MIKILSEQLPTVYLQSISIEDASDEYVHWLQDPQVNQYLETRFHHQNLSTITDFIKAIIANPNEHLFAIRLTETDQHIGNIKIGAIKPQHKTGEVSLFIGDKKSWGKGIASQAIQLISRYSIEQLKLRKLSAGAYKPNIASTKAFLKVGYQSDGTLSEHFLLNGQPCDSVQVCIFEHQLEQLPKITLA